MRHGKRVYDRSRYQLDFRNPAVIAHVNEVIDRVVKDYGVGYIKMDYNIEPGIGTELGAESVGQGLLEHEKAYLNWLDDVFARYPDLVIENCSSGGLQVNGKAYLAVWKRQMEGKNTDRYRKAGISCTDTTLSIPLSGLPFAKDGLQVSCLYPAKAPTAFTLNGDMLTVQYEQPVMARLFEITPKT